MKMNRRQLQQALNALAAANTKAQMIRAKISEHCENVYGFDPADTDFDLFIDSCDGGAGACEGMSVDDFEYGMTHAWTSR